MGFLLTGQECPVCRQPLLDGDNKLKISGLDVQSADHVFFKCLFCGIWLQLLMGENRLTAMSDSWRPRQESYSVGCSIEK
jgi:hypothetical protein